jgi:hypothetical protein
VSGLVCEELRQIEHDGEPYWLHVTITAEKVAGTLADAPLPSPPLPVRADLGRRIADLIRADLAAGAGTLGTCSPSS